MEKLQCGFRDQYNMGSLDGKDAAHMKLVFHVWRLLTKYQPTNFRELVLIGEGKNNKTKKMHHKRILWKNLDITHSHTVTVWQ